MPDQTSTTNGLPSGHSTVLLVEDTALVRQLLKMVLKTRDMHVIEACNGQEALDRIKVEVPDLILCDMMMPVVSGRELLSEVKNNPSTASIPVIILTAGEVEDSSEELLAMGAEAVIAKGSSHHEILDRVIATLRRDH